MRILFIKPKTDLHIVMPPISFLYLASHLEGHSVNIIDGHCYNFSDIDIIRQTKNFNPDLVCFGGLFSEIYYSLSLAKQIKDKFNVKIVFGGCHVTNCPEEILSKNYVDFVFRAESEIPFSEFVNKLEKNKDYSRVSNLGYKRNNKIILNDIKIYDFNDINVPRWDLINLRKYPKQFINKKHPYAPIFTTRGCPFSCTFCSSSTISGGKYRERDINKVIDELKYLKEKFGIKEFQIWDENFTLNKKRVNDFCNELIKSKLNLLWSCPNGVRIDTLDDSLLKKMKKAGCWSLCLPIEFGIQRMLDLVNKKTNLKKIMKIIPLVEINGIKASCFFIIGHPEETFEDINKTIGLAKSLPISRAYFSIYKVLVGSPDYYKYGSKQEKVLFSEGNPKLKKIQKYALLSFYLRPKQFFTFVRDNLSLSQFKGLLKIFNRFIIR